MKNKIVYRLKKLEKKHNIKILMAVEAGSRAYGINDDSSDWDVRFIYVHKLQWYLDLQDNANTIEFKDNSFDFSGWELGKSLKLLSKGNTQLQEWLNSPIYYIRDPEFFPSFKELAASNFNKRSTIRYYLTLSEKVYNGHIKGRAYMDPNMYLKAIRPLLCGLYVQKKGIMPLIQIDASIDLLKPYDAYDPVLEILKAKRGETLGSFNAANEYINDFIEETMYFLDMCLLDVKTPEIDMVTFNNFLYKQIMDFTNEV